MIHGQITFEFVNRFHYIDLRRLEVLNNWWSAGVIVNGRDFVLCFVVNVLRNVSSKGLLVKRNILWEDCSFFGVVGVVKS